MEIFYANLIKVGLAVLVGGVIGAEREFRDKAAGFRTIILITVGSALFTIFSISLDPENSRTRIAANIVTGIGFLGAGAIVREGGRIGGLTTAATIWLSAALGMGIGAGELSLAVAATVISLLVLLVFPRFEVWIDNIREARLYRLCIPAARFKKMEGISAALAENSLQVLEHHQTKREENIIGTWRVIGSPAHHEKFVRAMLEDTDIREFDY